MTEESKMSNVVADLCHSVISVITKFTDERAGQPLPDHVCVSCSYNDTAITFDIYLTKEEHATAQG